MTTNIILILLLAIVFTGLGVTCRLLYDVRNLLKSADKKLDTLNLYLMK